MLSCLPRRHARRTTSHAQHGQHALLPLVPQRVCRRTQKFNFFNATAFPYSFPLHFPRHTQISWQIYFMVFLSLFLFLLFHLVVVVVVLLLCRRFSCCDCKYFMLLIRSQGIPCAFTKYLPISHSKCFFIIIITIVQATGSKGAGGWC